MSEEQTATDAGEAAIMPGEATGEEQQQELSTADQQAAAEAEEAQKQQDLVEQQAIEDKPWFKKRMAKITRQKHEANRRAEQLQAMLDRAIGTKPSPEAPPVPTQPAVVAPAPEPEPQLDDFDTDAAYHKALMIWELDRRDALAKEQAVKTQQVADAEAAAAAEKAQREKENQTIAQKRDTTVIEGRKAHTDWDEVIDSAPPGAFSMDMVAALVETDNPSEVTYFLGKNPSEAERISKLPQLRKAVELGKIDAKLSTPALKKTTSAPAPISPVGGTKTATGMPDPEKDPKAWIAARNAGKIK